MGLVKEKWGGIIALMNKEELEEMQSLVMKRLEHVAPLDVALARGEGKKRRGDGKSPYWIAWADGLAPEAEGKRGRYAVVGDWTTRKEIERLAMSGQGRIALLGVRYPEQRYSVLRVAYGENAQVTLSKGVGSQTMILEHAELLFESDEWDEVREALVKFGVPTSEASGHAV